jgi:iron complex outermembrane recepter protein
LKSLCWASALILAGSALAAPAAALAQDASQLDLERLLNQQVTSASKYAQRIADAPSAVTVITADDIRRMGAADLPEVLRMVPGLNLRQKAPGSYATSARNEYAMLSPKILVLVDGRATMAEAYNLTIWQSVPLSIDQIERIEVVRGPGSALYGANAYDGVISITTKRPTGGTQVLATAGAGQFDEHRGSLLYRQSLGAVRIDAMLDRTQREHHEVLPGSGSQERLANQLQHGSVRLAWSNPAGVDVELSTGGTMARYTDVYFDLPNGFSADTIDKYYVLGSYSHPNIVGSATLGARAYVNRSFSTGDAEAHSYDAEATLETMLGTAHRLVFGVNAKRYEVPRFSLLKGEHAENLFAAYIQDTWTISSHWDLIAGVRSDRHPLSGTTLSPRASLLFKPSQLHTIRASGGRAFRKPNILEFSSDWEYRLSADMPFLGSARIRGNRFLLPESVTSHELGYIGSWGPYVTVTADLFHNHHADLVDLPVIRADTVLFPTPVGPVPVVLPREWMFQNREAGVARGGEVSVTALPASWLRTQANYAFTRLHKEVPGELTWTRTSAPAHKVNAEIGIRPIPSVWVNSTFHFTSEVDHSEGISGPAESAKPLADAQYVTPGYQLLNVNVSADVWRGVTTSLYVQNLLDAEHRDFVHGAHFGRRIVGKVSVQF